MRPSRLIRPGPLLLCALPLLPGCAFFGIERAATAPIDPSEVIYRAAMADLSACVTAPDAATAARIAEAAVILQADTRPTNPDHFYMTDRVTAAATYCAEAASR
jgi:hypothetical protein